MLIIPFKNILMGPDLGHHRNTALRQENPQGAERDRQESKLHIAVKTGEDQSSAPAEESGKVALQKFWVEMDFSDEWPRKLCRAS